MELKDVMNVAITDISAQGSTKDEVLRGMAARLLENGYISDLEEFVADIYRREAMAPTGMGNGISIPHGKSPAAKKMGIAVARTATPIPWESCVSESGWQKTRLIFLFCVCSDAAFADNHLSLLSQLAGKLEDKTQLERLAACKSEEELLERLLLAEEAGE